MSLTLSIQFLTGRYHATPWDHQVNEGVVEWPPSPWRILRSLVSAYYRLPEQPERDRVCRLLTQLADHPPKYKLPETTAAHTRHYMPIWKEGKATTTKVIDTFLLLPGGALSPEATVQVVWQTVQLSPQDMQLLQQLCAQVSYLGRAESWVEMSISEDVPQCNAAPSTSDAIVLKDSPETNAPNTEQVKVLVPLSSEGLRGFQRALMALPVPKNKKTRWRIPNDIMEALELDIGDLHRQGWNGIPGTDWMIYTLSQSKSPIRRQSSVFATPNFARYVIEVKNPALLPDFTAAVSIGERFRQALMSQSRQLSESGEPDPVFSGRDEDGNPTTANHKHAWYLSEPVNGKIAYVTIYARQGFSDHACAALKNLTRLWDKKGILQVSLMMLKRIERYQGESLPQGQDSQRSPLESPFVGTGKVWCNITPVVLPRHSKVYRNGKPQYDPGTGLQRDCPEDQIRKLLKHLEFPYEPEHVEVLEVPEKSSQPFRLQRYLGEGAKARDQRYWFELKFNDVQNGPLALGYAAHFGLGAFVPYSMCHK